MIVGFSSRFDFLNKQFDLDFCIEIAGYFMVGLSYSV